MVKSKKLSKSSLAVIILSLLLILSMIVGMTAAWFVGSQSGTDSGTGTDVVFGKLGSATITVKGVEWTNAKGKRVATTEDAVEGEHEVRTYYMPGDTLTGASVTVEYVKSETESKVYYIVAREKATEEPTFDYYVISGDKFVTTTAAGVLDNTTEKATFTAKGGKINVTGKTTGSKAVEVKRDNAKDITNDYQGQSVSYDNTTGLGFSMNGSDYELRVIQSTNLTPVQAYEALTTGWNANGGNTVTLG